MVFNHHKVKRDGYDEYVRPERTWKPLVEAWLKVGGKGSWVLTGLWMPAGESVPFNAMKIDIHPDWDALMEGVPVMDLRTSFRQEWPSSPTMQSGATSSESPC